jgi:hypothetical protein
MFSNAARKSSFDFVNVFKVMYILMQVIRTVRPKSAKKLIITAKFKHNIRIKKLRASKITVQIQRQIKNPALISRDKTHLNRLSKQLLKLILPLIPLILHLRIPRLPNVRLQTQQLPPKIALTNSKIKINSLRIR